MTVPSAELDRAKQLMLRRDLKQRGISDPRVLAAMHRVPRERFVAADVRDCAYDDRAMAIDCGQTISQPYMVALMSQSLELTGGERVLEIGTGSGYQTAILSLLAAEVFTIERHEPLSASAQTVLHTLDARNVEYIIGNGVSGWTDAAPYDRILVAAASPSIPKPLMEQLAEGGVMIIPVGPHDGQNLQRIRKIRGQFRIEELTGCRFVPLIGQKDS